MTAEASRPRPGPRADFPAGAAVVIGGSGGIGSAICTGLAAAGASIELTYLENQVAAARVADEIRQSGGEAHISRLALEDRSAVMQFFAGVRQRHGRIHTVVNATGASISLCYVSKIDPDEWEEVFRSDVNGFFNVVNASLEYLREHGGSYVTLSTAGLVRWPMKDVLSVAPKAAIQALVTGIAREEGRHGVRANSVALGLIDAGLFLRLRNAGFDDQYMHAALGNMALKRLGTADEVADSVVFLASDRARYVTGQTIVLDGGFSL